MRVCSSPSSQVRVFFFCVIIIRVEILFLWKIAINDPHLAVTEKIRLKILQGDLGEWTHGNNPPVAITEGENWPRQGLWMLQSMRFSVRERLFVTTYTRACIQAYQKSEWDGGCAGFSGSGVKLQLDPCNTSFSGSQQLQRSPSKNGVLWRGTFLQQNCQELGKNYKAGDNPGEGWDVLSRFQPK